MAARFPALIRVGPFRYKARRVKESDAYEESAGVCFTKQHRIEVTLGQSPLLTKERLLHEVLHALWDITFPDPVPSWDAYEERFVKHMAPVLLGLLRDNPTLVRYLTETLP